MSDGKIYKKNDDLSLEERLLELERKIPIFNEKIKLADKSNEDIEIINKKIDKIEEKIDVFIKNFEDTKKNHIENNNSIRSVIENIDNKHLKKNSDIQTLITNTKLDIQSYKEDLYKLIHSLESKIQTVDSSVFEKASKASLNEHKDFQNKQLSNLNTISESNLSKLNSFIESIKVIEQENELLKKLLSNHAKEISTSSLEMLNLKSQLKKSLLQQQEINKNGIESLKNEFIKIVNELKSTIPSVTPIDEINKKIQLIELDSNNAFLKAGNTEKLMKIIEKKIENFSLLLKKNELS